MVAALGVGGGASPRSQAEEATSERDARHEGWTWSIPSSRRDGAGRERARAVVEAVDGFARRLGWLEVLQAREALVAPVTRGCLLDGEESRDEAKEADAERPHVGNEAVVPVPRHHLGRAVRPRAAEGREELAVRPALAVARVRVREAEVGDLGRLAIRTAEEDVLELDVAVGDARRVEVATPATTPAKSGRTAASGIAPCRSTSLKSSPWPHISSTITCVMPPSPVAATR